VELAGIGIAADDASAGASSLEATSTPAQCAALVVCDQLRLAARLSRLPARGTAGTERALSERLTRLGLTGEELASATGRAIELLERCIADPQLQWILSSDHGRAEGSLALSGVIGGRLTTASIDRTFVDATGVRWLIDFVPGVPPGTEDERFLEGEMERHRIAVERSSTLARELGPEPLRAAIYFPGVAAWREITGGSSVRSLE
jgi:hypothetical protein